MIIDAIKEMRIIDAIKEMRIDIEIEKKQAKQAMESELRRRRSVILEATAELYPDKSEVPVMTEVQKLLASRGDLIPIDSIRVQSRKLRKMGRWPWPAKKVKVLNPIKSFVLSKVSGQPLRFKINEFVKCFYKERKSEPSIALISQVIRVGISTVEKEVFEMRQSGKWPISLKG